MCISALAYSCISAFIPKYLHKFFLKDNSAVIQGKYIGYGNLSSSLSKYIVYGNLSGSLSKYIVYGSLSGSLSKYIVYGNLSGSLSKYIGYVWQSLR